MTKEEEYIESIISNIEVELVQLRERVKKLNQAQVKAGVTSEGDWISIEDDQPIESGEYIITYGTSFIESSLVESGCAWWNDDIKEFEDWEDNIIMNVIHWMTLPTTPTIRG